MQEDLRGLSDARKERAVEVLNTRTPEKVNDTTYLVPSSDGTTQYRVRHLDAYSCTCPDYQKRCKENGLYCKHINAIILFNKLKNKVELEDFDVDGVTEKKKCPECESEKLQKYGIRKNKSVPKQRYKCLGCGTYFIIDPTKHLKGNARMVCLVLDMYYKGNSLRDIQDTLYKNFGLKLHHETVRRWINRFMQKITEYTNNLKPQTSEIMHIDEQVIRIKGEKKWCWNALDDKTRFLLANQITNARYTKDARNIIKKANQNVSQRPRQVATDKGKFYVEAIKKEFSGWWRGDSRHVWHMTRKKDNQLIERYHESYRERDKVMRGLKSEKTANQYVENWKTYYNFIRPNQAFNGQTPSELAGINIGADKNRWLSLLKLSTTPQV